MFYTISSIKPICRKLHTFGHKLVLVTGFFDLLHSEHILFLQAAKKAGDFLIVAVESDARARALKGDNRPIQTQLTRATQLREYSDYIILLPDNFNNVSAYLTLLYAVHPAVYAVSSHTSHLNYKRQLVQRCGGVLQIVHKHNPKVSSTKLIRQGILSSHV